MFSLYHFNESHEGSCTCNKSAKAASKRGRAIRNLTPRVDKYEALCPFISLCLTSRSFIVSEEDAHQRDADQSCAFSPLVPPAQNQRSTFRPALSPASVLRRHLSY